MNLLELTILTSLVCVGFKIATSTDMLLSFIGAWLIKRRGILWKPLYKCHYCMASIWSIGMYSLFMPYTFKTFYELPIMMLAVCAANGIVYNWGFTELE